VSGDAFDVDRSVPLKSMRIYLIRKA